MASKTKRTELQRSRKISNKGRARKRLERKQGTTRSRKELFGDK